MVSSSPCRSRLANWCSRKPSDAKRGGKHESSQSYRRDPSSCRRHFRLLVWGFKEFQPRRPEIQTNPMPETINAPPPPIPPTRSNRSPSRGEATSSNRNRPQERDAWGKASVESLPRDGAGRRECDGRQAEPSHTEAWRRSSARMKPPPLPLFWHRGQPRMLSVYNSYYNYASVLTEKQGRAGKSQLHGSPLRALIGSGGEMETGCDR
jgi:hypothetical protein